MSTKRGFTLVELLVVVAIIASLISMLLPSLRSARRQAYSAKCQNNLREFGRAMVYYAYEYDDYVPGVKLNGQGQAPMFAVAMGLKMGIPFKQGLTNKEVIKANDIFRCPDAPRPQPCKVVQQKAQEQPLTYIVNGFPTPYEPRNKDTLKDFIDSGACYLGDVIQTSNVNESPYKRLGQIRMPTDMLFLTEAHAALPSDSFTFHDVWAGAQLPRGKNPRVATDLRHQSGINLLFFDTHVDSLKPRDMRVERLWVDPINILEDE